MPPFRFVVVAPRPAPTLPISKPDAAALAEAARRFDRRSDLSACGPG